MLFINSVELVLGVGHIVSLARLCVHRGAGLGRHAQHELLVAVDVGHVVLVVRLLSEALAALLALERSDVVVNHHVIVDIGPTQELLATVRAVVELALPLRAVHHLERDERVGRHDLLVSRDGHDDLASITLFFSVASFLASGLLI